MRWGIHIALVSALVTCITANAQDPQLSQFYAAPQYLNPALTGNTWQERVVLNYRQQWPLAHKPYQTYAFAYDHHARLTGSNYGLMVMHDQAGTHDLSFTMIGGSYAHSLRIDREHGVRFGMRFAYVMRAYDPTRLLFADQIILDDAPVTTEPFLVERTNYLDIATGAVYHSENTFAGISFGHINRPDQSLISGSGTRLPVRSALHVGHRIPIDRSAGMYGGETYLTLAMLYKMQDKWDQLDLGGYIGRDAWSFGLWYRGLPGIKSYKPGYPNNDAIIGMVGYRTEANLRIAYSYDVTISWLTPATGGAHEVSLQYEWPKQRKARRYQMVPCPKF